MKPQENCDHKDAADRRRFMLNIVALLVGAVMLIMGGWYKDPVTQTAGGAVIAAIVGVIGWRQRRQNKEIEE